MSDIVERLRERPCRYATETEDDAKNRRQQEREEAADEIERLRAALREAEKGLNAMIGHYAAHNHVAGEVIAGDEQYPWVRLALIGRDAARAALGKKP